MRHKATATLLLLICLAHTFAWEMVPPEKIGQTWNLSGSIYRLLLLLLLAVAYKSIEVRLVCALLGSFEAMTAGCALAYLINPWPIIPGESCTARLNIPLGVIGAVLGLALLVSIVRNNK